MSAETRQEAVKRLIGDVRPLPLKVAADVAYKSIKVRLSRSLVTVSSVVLAVAFLLTVLGGDISGRAVFASYQADHRSIEDVGTLYTALAGPRKDVAYLELLAEPASNERLMAWARDRHPDQTTVPVERARDWLALTRWMEKLKATDRFKAIENAPIVSWLSRLDEGDRLGRFLDTVATFRGTRLPLEEAALRKLAEQAPELEQALTGLRQAERARLEQIRAAGGQTEIMQAIRTGELQLDELTPVGLPMRQLIPGMDADRYAALREQLRLDDIRRRANRILKNFNTDFSTARPIHLPRVFEGALDDDPRLPVLMADLEAAIGAAAVTDIGAAIARGTKLTDETRIEQHARMKEVLKEFNQTFAGRKTIPLTALIDGSLSGDRRMPLLRERLAQHLSAEELETLETELARIIRLRQLRDGLTAAGYQDDDGGDRTFWLVVLSLMVCIVGIVNSMMMAVTERFREIATMKCLGAMDSFILKAFLIESGSVGSVGAFLGAILGVLIVLMQSSARYGTTFWGAFPALDLLLACLAALACGVVLTIFGALLPAYKAARMHPIEAMRLEA